MAVKTRAVLIADAITRAGRKGQPIPLTDQFNSVLQYMTREYNILRGTREGKTVIGQHYVPLPCDYKERRFLKVDTYPVSWEEPDPFLNYITEFTTDPNSRPWRFAIFPEEAKVYMRPSPDAVYDYYFAYWKVHPEAGLIGTFTSGGTYEIQVGDTVTGATSGKTGVVSHIDLTSGKWESGTAAGRIILSSGETGFVAENLNVGSNLNVATISGDFTTADNFTHLLPKEFDEVITLGLASKVAGLAKEFDLAKDLWNGGDPVHPTDDSFIGMLEKKALKFKSFQGARSNFADSCGV